MKSYTVIKSYDNDCKQNKKLHLRIMFLTVDKNNRFWQCARWSQECCQLLDKCLTWLQQQQKGDIDDGCGVNFCVAYYTNTASSLMSTSVYGARNLHLVFNLLASL